jgi:hypothetical protein
VKSEDWISIVEYALLAESFEGIVVSKYQPQETWVRVAGKVKIAPSPPVPVAYWKFNDEFPVLSPLFGTVHSELFKRLAGPDVVPVSDECVFEMLQFAVVAPGKSP